MQFLCGVVKQKLSYSWKSILVLILLLRFNPWKIFQLVNRMFFLSGPEMVLFVIGLFTWCGEMLSRFDLIRTCQQRLFFFHHLHHPNYQNCLCSSYIYNFLPLGNGLLAKNVNMARTHFSMTSEIFSLDLKCFIFFVLPVVQGGIKQIGVAEVYQVHFTRLLL